ncbi:MAG: thioredoxin-dependent thiol peroxidase [Clostridiales bacterium]|nr:thioredoxin-dependent thiol peroxidase [Clostridiales bacterium]
MPLKVGDMAPDFTLRDENEKEVRLSDFRGQKVVLYFYPKDDTPGCTREACAFRDQFAGFRDLEAVVLGVSRDSAESHRRFKEKYQLPFPLLSDPDHQVAEAYGVWKEKTMFGKKSFGIERTTFVIDEAGRIQAIFRNIKPEEHVEKAYAALAKG